jgi:hypothetical protein
VAPAGFEIPGTETVITPAQGATTGSAGNVFVLSSGVGGGVEGGAAPAPPSATGPVTITLSPGAQSGLAGTGGLLQSLGALGKLFNPQTYSGITSLFDGTANVVSGLGASNPIARLTNLLGITQSANVAGTIAGTGGLTSADLLAAPFDVAGAAVPAATSTEAALSAGAVESATAAAGGGLLGGIGSALGAVAPFIAPAIGVGSLLAGLVSPRPPNRASGGVIDLSTGGITGFQSGGIPENDETSRQILSTLSQFSASLTRLTNAQGQPIGQLPTGALAVQAGTRDGIKVSYAGPLGNLEGNFASSQDAINTLELNIARNLQNTSATLKQVLANVTDASQIQDAIKLATAYDNLDHAFDDTFKTVGDSTTALGPFQQALNQINTTATQLSSQAQQYGLPNDPINAALTTAINRLNNDFSQSLNAAFDEAVAGAGDFIAQLKTINQTYLQNISDAQALGITDQGTQQKIAGVETAQAGPVLAGLSTNELQDVVGSLRDIAPQIAEMAQSLIDSGNALPDQITQLTEGLIDPVGLAIEKEKALGAERVAVAQAAGQDLVQVEQYNALSIQQIWKQATDSLKKLAVDITGGSLSGLTPVNQVSATLGQFRQELALVQGGNTNEIGNLASAGQAAITAAQSTYGNAPQTEQVRQEVLAGINSVIASPPSAIPSAALPAGTFAPSTSAPAVAAAPTPPTATDLTTAINDILKGTANAGDYGTVNLAVNAGVIDGVKQPQFAAVIDAAAQYATGQSQGLSAGIPSPLSVALQDAQSGAASTSEWVLINYAANTGIIDPVSDPQYAKAIQTARTIANANATALAQNPNLVSAQSTVLAGAQPYAAGTLSTMSGPILVGERGPEWMRPANDNWRQVGKGGPEIINQGGGAQILPFPQRPPAEESPVASFAGGTEIPSMLSEAISHEMGGYASGSRAGTPPGPILVGELGPEWMKPANEPWRQVGLSGPEVINQAGGAVILPFPKTPAEIEGYSMGAGGEVGYGMMHPDLAMTAPTFATGTGGDLELIPWTAPTVPGGPSGSPGNPMQPVVAGLKGEISDLKRSVRTELTALRRQTQAGQVQANKDARVIAGHAATLNRQVSNSPPRRQRLV